jgi:hypothetical protein
MFTSRNVSTLSVLLNDSPSAPSAELQNPRTAHNQRTPALPAHGIVMSEGYTIDGTGDEVAGIEPRVGRSAPWWPPEIERGAGDIDEKELQIRILMATWM